jgi:phage gp16-like protein
MNAARNDVRNRELAAIHVAKKQLGLDDGTYRDMLWSLERTRSSGDLDQAGRQRVLDHLRKRGFKRPVNAPARATDHGRKPVVPTDRQPLVDKIEALLADGAKPWNYARAMAKRICKVDQLEWASAEQLRKLVAALEYHKRRQAARAR